MRQVHTLTKVYTAQRNSNGNVIVCKGTEARKSYAVIATGSYDDCYMVKLGIRQSVTDQNIHEIADMPGEDSREPPDCPECARSFGPYYTGECPH